MKKLNQKGFGAIEIILLVLLVGIIAGAGYYVYQSQKKTNASLDKTNQNIETISKSQDTVNKAAQKSQETPKKYLEIKELGVKIELNAATDDAYYVMKNGYAYISTTSLKTGNAECGADKTGVVAIGKYKKTDMDEASGKTYGDLATDSGAVIGNDAFYLSRSQSYCSDDVNVQAKQQAAWNAFLTQAKTIQAL